MLRPEFASWAHALGPLLDVDLPLTMCRHARHAHPSVTHLDAWLKKKIGVISQAHLGGGAVLSFGKIMGR